MGSGWGEYRDLQEWEFAKEHKLYIQFRNHTQITDSHESRKSSDTVVPPSTPVLRPSSGLFIHSYWASVSGIKNSKQMNPPHPQCAHSFHFLISWASPSHFLAPIIIFVGVSEGSSTPTTSADQLRSITYRNPLSKRTCSRDHARFQFCFNLCCFVWRESEKIKTEKTWPFFSVYNQVREANIRRLQVTPGI